MTANTTTFGYRFTTYKDALTGCENAVFDKDAARQPATEEKSKLFDEAVIDQGAVKQQTKSMALYATAGNGQRGQAYVCYSGPAYGSGPQSARRPDLLCESERQRQERQVSE